MLRILTALLTAALLAGAPVGFAGTGPIVIAAGKLSPQTGGGQVVSPPFNVKTYGAVGDGRADDTSGVQGAIKAACAAGGGIVHLPRGTYKVTASGGKALNLQCSNVTLRGDGPVATRIAMASATGDTIQIGTAGGHADADNCKIEGLLFQPSVTRTGGSEVFAPAFHNLTIRDVNLKSMYRGFYLGSPLGSVNIHMQGVWAEDFVNFAYFVRVIQGTLTNLNTWGRRSNSVNLHIDGYCEGLVFTGGLFFNDYSGTPSGSYNLVTGTEVVSRPSQFNYFYGCYFDWGNYAVVAQNAYSYTFTDCWFKGRTEDGVLLDSTAHEFTFKGNDFFNSAGSGLHIKGSSGHVITGNRFLNNGTALADSKGIKVTGAAAGIVITSNRIGHSGSPRVSDGGAGAQVYGVEIGASVTSFIVSHNDCRGNKTGAVNNLAGTSSVKIVAENLF